MDMRRAPRIGHPIIDNLLFAIWVLLAATNEWLSVSQFADLMVGVGAMTTAILTVLRIYEHLAGETVMTTLTTEEQEVEA